MLDWEQLPCDECGYVVEEEYAHVNMHGVFCSEICFINFYCDSVQRGENPPTEDFTI